MKVEQLKQFIKVIDKGSISKAAVELHMAQSSLSMSIKILEEELGVSLIHRGNYGVTVTPVGREVYNKALIICKEIEDMKETLKKNKLGTDILTIANNYSIIGKDIFIDMYNEYEKRGCIFRIRDYSITEVMKAVATGEMEIGLLRFPENNKAEHIRTAKRMGLVYRPLARKVLCAIVGERNPFYKLGVKNIEIEQLTDYPFVAYYDEETDIVYQQILTKEKRPKANISISGIDYLKELVRKTDAFSFDVYKEEDFNSEELYGIKYIPITPRIYCEFGWIIREDRNLSKVGAEYIEKIEKHFTRYDEEPKYV